MLRRPDNLNNVADALVRLAIEGRVAGDEEVVSWLEAIGVAEVIDGELHVREEWVMSALPAKNARDLVRRTAFRDTRYRLHLDFLLARVLAKMARDNRMVKVEEYLTTKLSRFAPRFAWLLSQLNEPTNPDQWNVFEGRFLDNDDRNRFEDWDKSLFGDILGGAEQRFPLIADVYGVRAGEPVYARRASLGFDDEQASLLAEIIRAGSDRQGVVLSPEDEVLVTTIVAQTGLPIRVWRNATLGSRAACIGPVVLLSDEALHGGTRDRCSVPGELARELVTSKVTDVHSHRSCESIWAIEQQGSRAGAFPGVNIFETPSAVKSLFNQEQPDYLLKLASHPLFGLLFQFFVIGAFDRELGEDSLTVLRVGSAESPERIDVYYRPAGEDQQYQLIGSIHDVLVAMAEHLGVYTPPRLWHDSTYPLWTQAVLALTEAKIIGFQSGEFVLDKRVFDLCHSRDHMQAVLRRGQRIRDRIHEALRAQYEAKAGVVEAKV